MAVINHIGIIVDGNGRWAKEKGMIRTEGHKAGAKNLENLILYVNKENIANYLSLYVFSTENFERPKQEVDYLMDLFMKWFKTVKEKYNKENIRIIFSGQRELLKKEVVSAMNELEKNTKDNTGLTVNFCLSYGGRMELIDATKKIVEKVQNNELRIEDITESEISNNLYQKIPDVDYLIRTSGEQRLSGFMLWQCSYAEFYFPKTYFPDFNIDEFNKAIDEYKRRDRRFGKIKEESK